MIQSKNILTTLIFSRIYKLKNKPLHKQIIKSHSVGQDSFCRILIEIGKVILNKGIKLVKCFSVAQNMFNCIVYEIKTNITRVTTK